jgi:sulfite exporter TauE/SafE
VALVGVGLHRPGRVHGVVHVRTPEENLMRKLDKTDGRLALVLGGGLLIIAASFLVGCSSNGGLSDGWLPATRDYAGQVAADNAESAQEGNPASRIIFAFGTLISSLAGAGIMLRRFDAAPFQADDGTQISESELVHAAKQSIADSSQPTVTGAPDSGPNTTEA